MRSPQRRSAGFSLIEVLIALVILSVGLLGIAAMVSVSLKSKDSSYYQTQATALAQSILDRMRANRSQVAVGSYNINFSGTTTAQACLGSAAACTPAQIATSDLYDWRYNITNTFPSSSTVTASGKITSVAVGTSTQVTISIRWSDARANQAVGSTASDTMTYTLVSAL